MKYDDIIDLPHHVSKTYPQMSSYIRATQFASFEALTGHSFVLQETLRLTDEEFELDEQEKENLNKRFCLLKENPELYQYVSFTYFEPDKQKSGGQYITVIGSLKKFNEYSQTITLDSGETFPFQHVIDIRF